MKKLGTHFFGDKKHKRYKNTEITEENLRLRLNAAIEECELEKKREYDKIDMYSKSAKELIFEIFKVPESLWYEELKRYEEIKSLEINHTIDYMIIKKTDDLIEKYKTHIQLCETKIDYCNRFSTTLKEQIFQLDELKIEAVKHANDERQNEVLKQHSEFFEKDNQTHSNEKTDDIDAFEHLNETIAKINEDLRINQKVKVYMEQLESELTNENEKLDFKSLIELLDQLKKII